MNASGVLRNPWRGPKFPTSPENQQLFYLDVPNGNFPVRGWYIYDIPFTAEPTRKGDWKFLEGQ